MSNRRYFWVLVPIVLIVIAQSLGKWGVSFSNSTSIVNMFTLIAIALMLLRSVIWYGMLRVLPLKGVFPLLSISYVAILLVGIFLFGETVTIGKIVGTACILIGATIHMLGEAKSD